MIHIKHFMKWCWKRVMQMPKIRRPIALTLSIIIILGGSTLLWMNYLQVRGQQQQLHDINQQLEQQRVQNKELQDELARFSDPAYARQVEKSKYSLSNPKEGEYVFVLPSEGN